MLPAPGMCIFLWNLEKQGIIISLLVANQYWKIKMITAFPTNYWYIVFLKENNPFEQQIKGYFEGQRIKYSFFWLLCIGTEVCNLSLSLKMMKWRKPLSLSASTILASQVNHCKWINGEQEWFGFKMLLSFPHPHPTPIYMPCLPHSFVSYQIFMIVDYLVSV